MVGGAQDPSRTMVRGPGQALHLDIWLRAEGSWHCGFESYELGGRKVSTLFCVEDYYEFYKSFTDLATCCEQTRRLDWAPAWGTSLTSPGKPSLIDQKCDRDE